MKATVLLMLLTLILSSCRRDDSHLRFSLPHRTQEGANTFGFILNGKVWRNYGERCTFGGCDENLRARYFTSDSSMEISADRVLYADGTPNDESIYIYIHKLQPGRRIYSAQNGDVEVMYNLPNSFFNYTAGDTLQNFIVRFTRLDTAKGIMAGLFYGSLVRHPSSNKTSSSDVLHIFDGRFDLRYK